METFGFTDAQVFEFATRAVLPAWLMLILAPQFNFTKTFVRVTCIAQALLYGVLFYNMTNSGDAVFDMEKLTTLAGVRNLFLTERGVLAGWIHFLTFDLFIGQWIVYDAQAAKLPHSMTIPPIILTFLAGPIGLLSYLSLKTMYTASEQKKPAPATPTNAQPKKRD